ncbi:MAG TPA: hypothetical protein VLC74_08050 [Rhizomicrobium sp.]|nr:hypothetical protein [Rhizomicrobium sp.]
MDSAASPELDILRWQFDLAWRLEEHHLPHVTDAACLRQPAPNSWNVRENTDGAWRPDWADAEPDPAPPVTIGWLTWHLIWWWSSLITALLELTATEEYSRAAHGWVSALAYR